MTAPTGGVRRDMNTSGGPRKTAYDEDLTGDVFTHSPHISEYAKTLSRRTHAARREMKTEGKSE